MAVTDTSLGFKPQGRMSGGPWTIQTFVFKDTETLYKGDMINLESGEADLGATGDTSLVGVAMESKAGTDSTTEITVITDPDMIYAVYDANARVVGATLDLSGSAGAQTVTTSSNAEFIVVANSSADEWTLVRINPASHALDS